MSRRLKYVEGDDGSAYQIWTNPDIPTIDDIINANGRVEFACPNEDCDGDLGTKIEEVPEDLREMVDSIKDSDGTIRCGLCEEPIYGIHGDGDHSDLFDAGSWKPSRRSGPSNGPGAVKNTKP